MHSAVVFTLAILTFVGAILYKLLARPDVQPTKISSECCHAVKHSRAAVLYSKSGPYTVVNDWPRPQISPKELLIRTRAIGLNPIDWKCVAYGFGVHKIPWISGRDAAGIIEEVGSEVQGYQIGDRVFLASTNYRDNRTSTFQEYVAALPYNVGRLPDWISFEEGVTLGVGSVAAAAALFEGLAIPRRAMISSNVLRNTKEPRDNGPPWILIWGGSCVTGTMAIQLAKDNGFRVFTVASLQNASYLHSVGADKVANRHEPEQAILEARRLGIRLGIDCVGQQTATFAARALQSGGKLVYLVKKPDTATLEVSKIEATDILIKRFHEDAAYGQSLVDYISYCLSSKAIRPARHGIVHGGFEAIEDGLARLRAEAVSGRKLVISIDSDLRWRGTLNLVASARALYSRYCS